MVGDGFGGRLWYQPTNYTVGSYSAYSLCYDCASGESQLYGWGDNSYNQLGLGAFVPGVNVPTPIPLTNGVIFYSTGYIMGAIKNDGTGWAWGNCFNVGSIGNATQILSDVKFLDGSAAVISYVKNDGTVWSIGYNGNYNFGDGTPNSSLTIPKQMQNVNTAVRVANNLSATIILLNDSTLMACGMNTTGLTGLGPNVDTVMIPQPILGLPKIVDIKSNAMGTLALTANGQVYYWGFNMVTWLSTYNPILIPSLQNIVAISGCDDGYHFMALDSAKNCYTWGDNSVGQCGRSASSFPSYNTPYLVETDVIDIMAGETFSYLVKSDGSLWASGTSISSSIWLNLSNIQRESFTEIDPSLIPGSCELVSISANISECNDSTLAAITVSFSGGEPPYSYSIGGSFQNSPYFDSLGPGNYVITVQDTNNCQYQTSVTIQDNNCDFVPVPPLPEEGFIEFPNVFSPNQENENENFFFPNRGLTKIDCKIYDRWGQLVYEWQDINGFWNGIHSNGKECSEGTYYYILTYELNQGTTEHKQGHLTLIR